MLDCEAQRFPKGVLPLQSNPSVPLCLVSATPERLTVVAPGRRGSSQNVKMHHRGLFNSIASKPATNHLYPFIAKYRYSNVRQVLSENGKTRKTSWFIIISPDKNCDNTPCFGQTHIATKPAQSSACTLGFVCKESAVPAPPPPARDVATNGAETCKNNTCRYRTSQACHGEKPKMRVQTHTWTCNYICGCAFILAYWIFFDPWISSIVCSMPCNYAKKNDKRTALSNKRPGGFPIHGPNYAHIGTKKFEATILKSMEGHACCVFGGMHSPTRFTTIYCHQNVRSFVTNVTWKHVRMLNVSQLKRRYYTIVIWWINSKNESTLHYKTSYLH